MERTFSGRFVVRITAALHKRLAQISAREGKSLNELCIIALERFAGAPCSMQSELGTFFERLVKETKKRWAEELAGIVLFGSVARGTATAESDLDILVVLRPEASLTRARYREWDELMEHRKAEEAVVVSPQFVRLPSEKDPLTSLWLEVSLDGVVLWENGFAVSRVFSSLRRRIAASEVSRGESHGQGYWRIQ